MPRIFCALILGALITSIWDVQAPRAGGNTQTIEVWHIPPYQQMVWKTTAWVSYFYASGQGLNQEEVPSEELVYARSGIFFLSPEDLELVVNKREIRDLPDRREKLNGVIAELTRRGWQPAGQGQFWYNVRFQRPKP
jgi:hypothetical protein